MEIKKNKMEKETDEVCEKCGCKPCKCKPCKPKEE